MQPRTPFSFFFNLWIFLMHHPAVVVLLLAVFIIAVLWFILHVKR